MVSVVLHPQATTNMKSYFWGYISKSYGKFDSQDMVSLKLKEHNIKIIRTRKSGYTVNAELEWQKLLFINMANDYILANVDRADKIARAGVLKTAIQGELDSGIDAYYSPLSYLLERSPQ